jgi:hypothetical protein
VRSDSSFISLGALARGPEFAASNLRQSRATCVRYWLGDEIGELWTYGRDERISVAAFESAEQGSYDLL